MFPNHRCHPCVKWVSHRWRSHYSRSACVCLNTLAATHTGHSDYFIDLLCWWSQDFACWAYCTSDSISNNPRFGYEVRNKSFLPWGNTLVNVDGVIIPLDSSRRAFHWGCTSVVLWWEIKWQLLSHRARLSAHYSHTLNRSPTQKDVDSPSSRTLTTAYLLLLRVLFKETLGGQHWACWRLNRLSFKTASSKMCYLKNVVNSCSLLKWNSVVKHLDNTAGGPWGSQGWCV